MNTNKKQKLSRVVSVVIFLALVILTYHYISRILEVKLSNDRGRIIYNEPKDSLDVVFVGSSHIYYGISPMQIWHRYGITSVNYASPSQGIPMSYYMIKEAVRRQHPKVIVLDVYYMFFDIYCRGQGHLHEVTDAMPFFSRNRFDMINDIVPNLKEETDVWSFYFTIAYSHSRWKELGIEDFFPNRMPYMKGQLANAGTVDVQLYEPSDRGVRIPEVTLEYLEKIRAFCEENDTELLLVCIPYSMTPDVQGMMEDHLAMLEQLEVYAKENGYHFLNMYDRMEQYELSLQEDFFEAQHLNVYGAKKISLRLGMYLQKNYGFPDNRKNPEYTAWNEDYSRFNRRIRRVITNASEAVE